MRSMAEAPTLEDLGRGPSLGLGKGDAVAPFTMILQKTEKEGRQGHEWGRGGKGHLHTCKEVQWL